MESTSVGEMVVVAAAVSVVEAVADAATEVAVTVSVVEAVADAATSSAFSKSV